LTAIPTAARAMAIAIAIVAAIDPTVRLPSRARPALNVMTLDRGREVAQLQDALTRAGFALDASAEAATVVVGNRVPRALQGAPATPAAAAPPVWALDTTPPPPNVRIVNRTASTVRFPEQAVDVRVTLEGRGVAGKTSEITLEDAGIPVAAAKHAWSGETEHWQAVLQYLPPGARAGRLRITVAGVAGETTLDDNVADVGVPPLRGPVRVLVVEAGVTWPALFVRRAIEGEPGFAVAAVQRMTPKFATRAGAPPTRLTREALTPFEAVLIGAPDRLTAPDLDALRWFVEERGGVAVIIPDARPTGRYVDLFGAAALEPRAVDAAVPLAAASGGSALMASELLVTVRLPGGARPLAATAAHEPVVFAARRGAGGVIFSGALDAWRYRARDEDAFARFWRHAIAEEVTAAPPVLDIAVDPVVAAGAATRVSVRLRATELPAGGSEVGSDRIAARAVGLTSRVDVPVRLWPVAEPGVYEGEWTAPAPGEYTFSVTAGSRSADATVTAVAALAGGSVADPSGLALVARATGGQVFPADRSAGLVEALKTAYPAIAAVRPMHPMRSAWWVVPFAALLAIEWAFRRRRGLP
jgi:peptidoglycan hydrolase-like protein with peptidoglycan-binding domain